MVWGSGLGVPNSQSTGAQRLCPLGWGRGGRPPTTVAREYQSLEMYYDSIQFTTTTLKVNFDNTQKSLRQLSNQKYSTLSMFHFQTVISVNSWFWSSTKKGEMYTVIVLYIYGIHVDHFFAFIWTIISGRFTDMWCKLKKRLLGLFLDNKLENMKLHFAPEQ